MARLRPRRLGLWALGGVIALAVLVVGGTWIYIHLIEGPAPAALSLKSSSSASAGTGTDTGVTGTWRVVRGSVVGYRVNEVLAGQQNVAVGRTSNISGSMTVSDGTVTSASFTVQMATIHSDQSQRDAQFNGRIMDTAAYPKGTLTLTSSIALGNLPAEGVIRTYQAAGNLTLRGRTRPITFRLQAERTTAGIEVSGSISVLFANWGIANPSFGSFVTTQNDGQLEFLVKFAR